MEPLLRHLEAVGFTGAPRFLGVDERGRQALSFVEGEGEVAGRPWPTWVVDEDRPASVTRLVRGYDDAALTFGVPAFATAAVRPDPPGTPAPLPAPAVLVGHQDVTPENVVFVDGQASALIDLDMARPTDRVGEVADVLLWSAPLMPPGDREAVLADVDAVRRARIVVDAYGLDVADRARGVPTARNVAVRSWYLMRARSEQLGGGWRRMWQAGVGDRTLRRQAWLDHHAHQLHEVIHVAP